MYNCELSLIKAVLGITYHLNLLKLTVIFDTRVNYTEKMKIIPKNIQEFIMILFRFYNQLISLKLINKS